MKFNCYESSNVNVDSELSELLYGLTLTGAEVRFDFGNKNGTLNYTLFKNFTFKGQLTKTKKGFSELYATKRASQTDKYAINSIMKVYVKENKKYRLVYENSKLLPIEYIVIKGVSPDGYSYVELYAKTEVGKVYVIGYTGDNADTRIEKAIRFYKGETYKPV